MTRHVPPINDLENIALSLRRSVVSMVDSVRVGYLLQGLGAADIFAALFFSELTLRTDDPNWSDRDRFILSTAHNTALLYATFTRNGSELEVNASERVGTIVEATCGSLGQGLSVAVGMALSLRRRGSEARVYVVLGDGELQEGQVWEAALSAGSFGLDNLCMIVDRNYLQAEGHSDRVVKMGAIPEKFESFGWNATEVDGNNLTELLDALRSARATKGKPFLINALTKTGAGVPFLEGQLSHVALLSPEDAQRALAHLEGQVK
jgi:transketolase